ncbi:unnamed protein product [Chrysoparadoxa australica]
MQQRKAHLNHLLSPRKKASSLSVPETETARGLPSLRVPAGLNPSKSQRYANSFQQRVIEEKKAQTEAFLEKRRAVDGNLKRAAEYAERVRQHRKAQAERDAKREKQGPDPYARVPLKSTKRQPHQPAELPHQSFGARSGTSPGPGRTGSYKSSNRLGSSTGQGMRSKGKFDGTVSSTLPVGALVEGDAGFGRRQLRPRYTDKELVARQAEEKKRAVEAQRRRALRRRQRERLLDSVGKDGSSGNTVFESDKKDYNALKAETLAYDQKLQDIEAQARMKPSPKPSPRRPQPHQPQHLKQDQYDGNLPNTQDSGGVAAADAYANEQSKLCDMYMGAIERKLALLQQNQQAHAY